MAKHPYTLQWGILLPSKLPLPIGDLDPPYLTQNSERQNHFLSTLKKTILTIYTGCLILIVIALPTNWLLTWKRLQSLQPTISLN